MKICNLLPINVCKSGLSGTETHTEAVMAYQKFKFLFSKYSVCHKIINQSATLDQQNLELLGMS